MNLLSKDQIFQVDDREYEIVHVPEWGGDVRIRALTGAELDDYNSSMDKVVNNKLKHDTRNARAKLIALSAVDGDGLPLFTKADVIKLGSKSSAALQRLFDACCRLSGMDEDTKKEIEEDFDSAPSGASTTDSPSPSAAVPSPNSWPVSPHAS